MASINFFSQSKPFTPSNPRKTKSWLRKCLDKEGASLGQLDYIFCTDEELLEINLKYLGHDTYTDIVTFDLTEGTDIEAEIYISTERVQENALEHGTSFQDELRRVMSHGVLHLIGFKDKTPREKSVMREKEDAWLSLW